ncbi:DNA mismatch repair protein MutS [Thermoflexus sp.]|uniref:DNA mismatch repair protein MutS n=1 Tax=Thermoflexus sp. TaxID=1969742 RepID=UPI0025DA26F7|nr:DNA mismatch repair protein MutS [Thermoflexus sp.]MDW8179761.1 DNA mismatch repair protein MutS [Anaerolineae bacterium]MCS6963501.1 DNA mismatch repair protein MutS [Thermoflexus sp.]MCS7350310.1 DNA mismatch repair protein MutS [Thermoflexus sp.]MCX7689635.1 DNA mismatch repair protein MutS [Thermoflexus sp.]MDW8184789.1 DNA mismatch repair protein MutS [Anaerolineae bacterium]
MEDLTPIRRQYLELKRQYPDAVLFFRLGDFYEAFDEDAEVVARELDLMLTSRPVGKGQRVPMAGIPYHAVEPYLARLVERGYRVAIAEQVGEPVNGLMPRRVVRVVTPGTALEPTLLDERKPNYLAAWIELAEGVGLAYCEVSTGHFATTQWTGPEARREAEAELLRLDPRECLYPAAPGEPSAPPIALPADRATIHFTPFPAYRFELGVARAALQEHFQVVSLHAFGLEDQPLALRAAGAIIQYLRETRSEALSILTSLETYTTAGYMVLDPATRRNLELIETMAGDTRKGSLLSILDFTRTPMGGRLLRAWISQPLRDRAAIEARLDQVEAFVEDPIARERLAERLRGFPDLERLAGRARSGLASPRDLAALRRAMAALPELQTLLLRMEGPRADAVRPLAARLAPLPELQDLLTRALVEDPPATLQEGGVIRPGFSEELDRWRAMAKEAQAWLADLEQRERERTGIRTLKVGYNKVFGYYIEISKAAARQVPPDYVRKQTLVNAERFITPELKDYETRVLSAEARQAELEAELFRELCHQVGEAAPRLREIAGAIAHLDVVVALAEAAARHRYVRPELVEEDILEIRGGRHPVVERALADRFIPNDVVLNEDARILILTGPNMAGKSTLLRQVALIVLMAQIGSFVPADQVRLRPVDRIFTRIGAHDELAAGRSTFMVEMSETAYILHQATAESLVVLDEIGRGTSTYDGLAIAWAVAEYLHNHPKRRPKVLFATHYHELTALAAYLPRVRNAHMAVAEVEGRIVFLYQVRPGGADRSYGIHVAELAGLPRPVIRRARELLSRLERGEPAVRPKAHPPATPLPLFAEHPVVHALRRLDPETLSPLEALHKLYELKGLIDRASSSSGSSGI